MTVHLFYFILFLNRLIGSRRLSPRQNQQEGNIKEKKKKSFSPDGGALLERCATAEQISKKKERRFIFLLPLDIRKMRDTHKAERRCVFYALLFTISVSDVAFVCDTRPLWNVTENLRTYCMTRSRFNCSATSRNKEEKRNPSS